MKKTEILPKIFLVEFDNQEKLGKTLLRFEEYYESPEFKGKIFSFDEYKAWYSRNKGEFTYFEDWDGFNLPSWALKPFYDGKFDPLSEDEKQFLDLFREEKGEFYVIALQEQAETGLLLHEIAHGFFYLNPQYKSKVLESMSRFDLQSIKIELKEMDGYSEEVLDDEVHAWILGSPEELISGVPEELKKELTETFNSFCPMMITAKTL